MNNDAITRIMQTQGRKMTWLARKLGVSKRTLQYRMRGEFSVEEQQRIADIFDLPVDRIFGGGQAAQHVQSIHRENI